MLQFPNAKINIGLSVLRKRPDGYHDLETVFVPVAWCDALEFIPAETTSLHTHGIQVTGNPESNLVWKAYALMRTRFPSLPPLEIHLEKIIPHGAGLGGGSADAAFMLNGLNTHFALGLQQNELIELALQLGSDCPFFIYNRPCLAYGRGEQLKPINLNLASWRVVLIKPNFSMSTALAFQGITPKEPAHSLAERIAQPIAQWRNNIVNDFEAPLIQHYPHIALIRDSLYQAGCTYASLSGSGSTVFGLFEAHQEQNIQAGLTELHKKIRDLQVKITDILM
jgi:4-diphosphocytidyl-2-C-methyl-D-erythritol kinase